MVVIIIGLNISNTIGDIKGGREVYPSKKYLSPKYIWVACVDCGKERWVELKDGKPKSLRCYPCAMKNRSFPVGEKHPNWQGGKYKSSTGYICIKLDPNDFFYPMIRTNGYVLEHRLIVARALGRCLLPWEIVHHKNGIKGDNRYPENLELLPAPKHHLVDTVTRSYIVKLEKRITLLESELTALHYQLKKEGITQNER